MNRTGGSFTVFDGTRLVARGPWAEAGGAARRVLAADPTAPVLVFDDATGAVADLEPAPKAGDAPSPPAPVETRGRGRPKLGVVSREVTLLPRHWEWLSAQPGGASAALRRLIDEARRTDAGRTDARLARERAYRFMSAMAGDLPGFEEASRALFAGEDAGLDARMAGWPADVRTHVLALARAGGTS
jgi:hypothetical protein